MKNSTQTGEGAIAVHRWFSTGEGWAYHPWYQARFAELLDVVKTDLQQRPKEGADAREQLIDRPALGGFVLGLHGIDPQCQDARARDRNPTIYRVVFLRHRPTASERARLWDQLRRVAPECPGVDANLELSSLGEKTDRAPMELSETPAAPGKVARPQPVRRRFGLFLCLIVLAGIAGVLGWFGGIVEWPFGGAPTPPKDDWDSTVRRMADLLSTKWQDPETRYGNPKLDRELVDRFFTLLSQDPVRDKLEGKHPDVQFLQRLPEHPLCRLETPAASSSEELAKLRKAITELLAKLGSPAQGKPTKEMVENIGQAVDYQTWWKNHHEKLLPALITNPAVDGQVRAKVYRFCGKVSASESVWQCEPAKDMVKSLNEWGVSGLVDDDAEKRPWLVFAAYFYFLSRQDLPSPEALELKEDRDNAELASKLPEKPARPTGCFKDEAELTAQLAELAKKLGIKELPDRAGALVEVIGRRGAGNKEYRVFLRKNREGPRLPNGD
jgi:hypothetical protein